MGVHRYNHNLETARSYFPQRRHHAHLGGALGDAAAGARVGHGGLLRRHRRHGRDARAARRVRRAARRARARRGAAELPQPAAGHAVRRPGAGGRRRTRCARSRRSGWRCRARSCASPAAARSPSATSAPAQGLLGGINAVIVGNYLTTLGATRSERPRPARRAVDAGQGAERDAVKPVRRHAGSASNRVRTPRHGHPLDWLDRHAEARRTAVPSPA